MPRRPDPKIPSDEPLYRSVSKEHVDEGLGVLATAVDMPACSFNRSMHSKPGDVFVPSRPNDNGILEITPQDLPGPIPRASAEPYEFFAADDPCPARDPENEAHCEIRIARTGTEYSPKHKPAKDIKLRARDALAKKLRVHKPPT
jgi:hypothetical protein